MTIDTELERPLRTVLSALRPAGGAPEALRDRVLQIPDSVREARAIVRVVRAIGVPLAAVGAAATAVALAAFGITRMPTQGLPPEGVGGAVTGFDPALTGPGLLTDVIPTAVIVGLSLVVVGGATAAGTFLSSRLGTNRGRAIVLAGIGIVLAGIWLIRFDFGVTAGGLRAAPLGYVEEPAGSLDHQIGWISTADPGEPTVGVFALRNTSMVPIRIEGLVVAPNPVDVGRWTAVWMPPGGSGYEAPTLDEVRPFEPVTLEPGAEVNLYVAGRAGRCAFGSTFDPIRDGSATAFAGYSAVGPEVTVAFSAFGLTSIAQVDIGERFAEPARNNCFG
jgi:hypothetical protein